MKITFPFLIPLFMFTSYAQQPVAVMMDDVNQIRFGYRIELVNNMLPSDASFKRIVDNSQPVEVKLEKKSAFLGVLFSVLLPGMGELYSGNFAQGQFPLIADGALWLGVLGLNAYGNWLQTDSRSFAAQFAGIAIEGKDDQFFVNIENYNSRDAYNEMQLVNRNLNSMYPSTQEYNWRWPTESTRKEYKAQRILSDKMFNAVGFAVLGMIANRIWSAIQASMFINDRNRSIDESGGSMLKFFPQVYTLNGKIDAIRLSVTQPF